MIVPSSIQQRFNYSEPYVDRVARLVRDVVFAFCESHGYAFVGRKKTASSVSEKIETGRYVSWNGLDDLYGCTIVIPTLVDEAPAIDFLEATFVKAELRRRGGTLKQPDVFRFDSTRFIGKVNLTEAQKEESELGNILFEVQVRTAFEHAWSVATREFAYKSDEVNWRRSRLAAQLKASVEQLDALVLGFDAMSGHLSEHEWPIISAKRHLEICLKKLVSDAVVPIEVAPESWARFCDNMWTLVDSTFSTPMSKKLESAQKAAEVVERRARAVAGTSFPRSITLLQFCLASLMEEGFINKPIKGYTPLITRELLDLFPVVQKLGAGFNFDEVTTADASPEA